MKTRPDFWSCKWLWRHPSWNKAQLLWTVRRQRGTPGARFVPLLVAQSLTVFYSLCLLPRSKVTCQHFFIIIVHLFLGVYKSGKLLWVPSFIKTVGKSETLEKGQRTLLMFILGQFFGQIPQIFAARFAPRLPFSVFLPFFSWPNIEYFRASLRSPERDNGWGSGGDGPLPKCFFWVSAWLRGGRSPPFKIFWVRPCINYENGLVLIITKTFSTILMGFALSLRL